VKRWIWLDATDVLAYHAEQISEHGGSPGLRDLGLLESALARPQNLAAYGQPTVFELAAGYAAGLAKNHPFVDGNKRTAFVACVTFIELHGWQFAATEEATAIAFLELAGGKVTERELARWLEANSRKPARRR
jgi:death-on-curing protein